MNKIVKYVGLDVHKDSITIAIADEGRDGNVRVYGKISNDLGQIDNVMRKLISQNAELHCVYEAGPCGYPIYRHLTSKGIDCVVVAPALIPKKTGDRVKNDRRDATHLATLHRSGELTPVYVPDQADEALRDLVRARKDIQISLRKVKQQINAFLLRQGINYPGKSKWSKAHLNWLADLKMPHPAQHIALTEYLDAMGDHEARVKRIEKAIEQCCQTSRLLPVIEALQALRGISLLSAVTVVAELGDLSRFDTPAQLMAYLGLIPSEHSSGGTIKKGPITKTGNTHARRTLIESAQAYRMPARKSKAIRKRQEGLPDDVLDIAWNAQLRLCHRYRRLIAKGKNHNVVITAIARELAGFIWAIARAVPIVAAER
ncbi:IS110 family transposase [Desulfosarcina ovata]|uniref:IS110 family transposase n=1 Tax=Desulfosarcina ovata subsp. ovata TaxID=2752305 RepID=A0A5K8A9F5_9BACT|nr:IS110 family transposase [Desulfosarcina ovata]BBO89131.1 IS110 family transposase [Desulfosarcina ovata subsp. ovata]BBO92786.1 IS110 family transposase [Desulfosarcina ovata subsp. ovata]